MRRGDILCPVTACVMSNGGARPRVLLVDDHAHIIDVVSASLADEFDVAAVSTACMPSVATAATSNSSANDAKHR